MGLGGKQPNFPCFPNTKLTLFEYILFMIRRIAAVDVGSNTIRTIIVESGDEGSYRILDDEKASVRLGENLSSSGIIARAAWERATQALQRMAKIIEGYRVARVEAVATSAVRSAQNGEQFVRAIKEATGIDVRIITGEEEALLAVLSAQQNFNLSNNRYALLDIGGGSAEIVTAMRRLLENVYSLDLGTVRMAEEFITSDPVSADQYRKLKNHIKKQLRIKVNEEGFAPAWIIGSGGTITSIGHLVKTMRGEKYDSVHGYEVRRSEIVHLLAMLVRTTGKERRNLAGLSPDRIDLIIPGIVLVNQVMKHLGANVLRINERGIREGLIIRSLENQRIGTNKDPKRDLKSSLEDLARSFQIDMVHSRQVTRLSLMIFDALRGPAGLDAKDRLILEAAALLHDIGYFIGYNQHHKHSYHLIRHAKIFDFSPRDRELAANVARYHRRALPKLKHRNFSDLSTKDRELVKKLGAILRLADGLDRRRNAQVRDMQCRLSDDNFSILISGPEDLSVEIHWALTKGKMFKKVFGLELCVRGLAKEQTGWCRESPLQKKMAL